MYIKSWQHIAGRQSMAVIMAVMVEVAWCFVDHQFMYDNLFCIFWFEARSLSWKQQQLDNVPVCLSSSPFTIEQLLPAEGQNPPLPLLFTSLPPVALIQFPDLPLNFCIRPLQIKLLEEVPFLLWFILFALKWRPTPLQSVGSPQNFTALEAQGQVNLCSIFQPLQVDYQYRKKLLPTFIGIFMLLVTYMLEDNVW